MSHTNSSEVFNKSPFWHLEREGLPTCADVLPEMVTDQIKRSKNKSWDKKCWSFTKNSDRSRSPKSEDSKVETGDKD